MRGNLLGWLLWLCCLLPAGVPAAVTPQHLVDAERLLAQAAHHPDRAGALVRQAHAEVPDGACPALDRAREHPQRDTVLQARQEVYALYRASVLSAPVSPRVSPAHARLQEVLARPEFRQLGTKPLPATPKPPPAWLTRILEALKKAWSAIATAVGKVVKSFFTWVGGLLRMIHISPKPINMTWLNGFGTGWRYFVIILLSVIALFFCGVLVNRLMLAHRQRQAPAAADDDIPQDPVLRRRQEPSFWERSLRRAEELWANGEQREALRILSRACLVLLDARGVLRYEDARANGEVLRELRRQGRQAIHDGLRPIIRRFEWSWYGFLPVSSDEFTSLLETSRHFRATVVEEA